MSRDTQISVSLHKAQIDFLKDLMERIKRESHKKISRCEITKVLMETLTCIKKVDIRECRSEGQIGKELLKCLKKSTKEERKICKMGKGKSFR